MHQTSDARDLAATLVAWAKARLDENECDQGHAPSYSCEGCDFETVCNGDGREYRLERAIIATLEGEQTDAR